MGPKSNDWCPSKKERRCTDREEDYRGRAWSVTLQAREHHQMLGRNREGPFLRALRGSVALPNVDFTSRSLRESVSVVGSH